MSNRSRIKALMVAYETISQLLAEYALVVFTFWGVISY